MFIFLSLSLMRRHAKKEKRTKKNALAEAQGGSDELSPELYDAAVAIFDCTGGKKNEHYKN